MTGAKKIENEEPKEELIQEVKEERKESLIYCGGNFPAGKLASYTVFKNGVIPVHVKVMFEKCPALSGLIVKLDNFSHVMAKLQDKNSAEYQLFKEVENFRLGSSR